MGNKKITKNRIVFIDYMGYTIETAPKGYWVTREYEGEYFILATVETINEAKEYIKEIGGKNGKEKNC